MAYRNLFVQGNVRISVCKQQLCIANETESTVSPEDVQAILIESQQSAITTAALSLCAQEGITLYVCDQKHLPCGVLLPFSQHSRQPEVFAKQIALTQPSKNRLWQQLVVAKIENQALCLQQSGKDADADYLQSRARAVQSGDKDNIEAVAAAYYFKALFGNSFTRSNENGINSALNYGYAIMRGAVARSLAAYGFLPALGLHHCSGLNSFNLADDFIEPFRPVVDLFVATNVKAQADLTPVLKQSLFNLLNNDILSGGQHHSVAYAIERSVQSFSRCVNDSKQQLLLPQLLALAAHSYE